MLERNDFASATSSRSSKLVHGGLRYLKQFEFGLALDSVQEREALLKEAPGLVTPLQFAMPIYKNIEPGKWMMETGLTIYDVMAGHSDHSFVGKRKFLERMPRLQSKGLKGGFFFKDAQVDDARLVLKLLFETEQTSQSKALNYHEVKNVLRDSEGQVTGISVIEKSTGKDLLFQSKVVINATGAWVENFAQMMDSKQHIRPLRGSHLVFPFWKLPVPHALSIFHPDDQRPVMVIPWEGVVLFGTTDLDHHDLNQSATITQEETTYLMKALHHYYPGMDISINDCISSFSGIRPVISEGGKSPSEESREHEVWEQQGLVSVTGGKLTTFRKLAHDALEKALQYFPQGTQLPKNMHIFLPCQVQSNDLRLSDKVHQRLCGRYGGDLSQLLDMAPVDSFEQIEKTDTFWAELPMAAKEKIVHLDDILLRRVRLGLQLPQGGLPMMDKIKQYCAPQLDWDDEKWQFEIDRYKHIWQQNFAPTPLNIIKQVS